MDGSRAATLEKDKKGGGANKTIDFVLFRNDTADRHPGLIFLEVEYLKKSNSTGQFKHLLRDIVKLRSATATDLLNGTYPLGCSPKKFMLVVAQEDDLQALVKVQFRKSEALVKMLASALRQKPPRGIYRSIVETRLKEELHWNAIAFGETAWPD